MLIIYILINDYFNFREYCIVLYWYIFDIICSIWINIYWSRFCSDIIDIILVDFWEYIYLFFGFILWFILCFNFIYCICIFLMLIFFNCFCIVYNGCIFRWFLYYCIGYKYWKIFRVIINVWGFCIYIVVVRFWVLINEFFSKKNLVNVIKMIIFVLVIMNSVYGFIFWL